MKPPCTRKAWRRLNPRLRRLSVRRFAAALARDPDRGVTRRRSATPFAPRRSNHGSDQVACGSDPPTSPIPGCSSSASSSSSFCCWITTPTIIRCCSRSPTASKARSTPRFNCFREYFRLGILTDPVLQVGVMIAYVYVVCLLIFSLLRVIVQWLVDLAGLEQFPLAAKLDCARARHCGLPRLAAARAHKAGRLPASTMGGRVCVAGERRAALPAAGRGDSCTARSFTLRCLAAQPCCCSISRRFPC